jgi:hypothetical protein
MDVRFGLWNVRSLYRIGSLMIVSRELLVGTQVVRWEGGGNRTCGRIYIFLWKGERES